MTDFGIRAVGLSFASISIIFLLSMPSFAAAYSSSNDSITQQWVNQEVSSWKPSTIYHMGFGAVLTTASYGNVPGNSIQVVTSDLNMLASTGIGSVRIDINYAPWLQLDQKTINEISSAIQGARNIGLKIIIADAASETYRSSGGISWSQFQRLWIQRVRTIASLYNPDYYIVIKEPGWYVPMVSDSNSNPLFRSPSSWINLTQNLADAVLGVSPNTKVGVSVAADSVGTNPSLYVPYLRGIESLGVVSFVGFDIYTKSGFTTTRNFLTKIGSGGKSIWIAEAWSAASSTAGDPSRANLDSSWIQMLYYFGESQIHVSMIIPFYTNNLAQYSTSSLIQDPSFFISREPVYCAYQSIISSNKALTIPR